MADTERKVKTLRLPEICTVDLAEEEAEGVADEGMMERNQACGAIMCSGGEHRIPVLTRRTFRQSLVTNATGAVNCHI